jgi:hypothetical protein
MSAQEARSMVHLVVAPPLNWTGPRRPMRSNSALDGRSGENAWCA